MTCILSALSVGALRSGTAQIFDDGTGTGNGVIKARLGGFSRFMLSMRWRSESLAALSGVWAGAVAQRTKAKLSASFI
jgi:hypothetical protein